MKTLAALKALMAYCTNMVSLNADQEGGFAKAGEICKQLLSLGEDGLGRLLQLMNYVKELTKREDLPPENEFRRFLDNNSTTGETIDCDADPFIPNDWNDWKAGKHIKGGMLKSDSPMIFLYISPHQKASGHSHGYTLLKGFMDEPAFLTLNANVLDHWFKHPGQIPKGIYKALQLGNKIVFWGTIYVMGDGSSVVRYLYLSRVTGYLACNHIYVNSYVVSDFLAAAKPVEP